MHEVLVNRLGGLSLPRESVVRLTDRPDMTLDVYRGRKTAMQQQQQILFCYTPFLNETKLLTDRPDMTLDVYRGRKTTMQQQQQILFCYTPFFFNETKLYPQESSFRRVKLNGFKDRILHGPPMLLRPILV